MERITDNASYNAFSGTVGNFWISEDQMAAMLENGASEVIIPYEIFTSSSGSSSSVLISQSTNGETSNYGGNTYSMRTTDSRYLVRILNKSVSSVTSAFASGLTYSEDVDFGSTMRDNISLNNSLIVGNGDLYYREDFISFECRRCSNGWTAGGNPSCTGTVNSYTLTLYIEVVDPSASSRNGFSNRCPDDSDPTLYDDIEIFDRLSVSTDRGDHYSEALNLLDISAYGTGSVTIQESFSFTPANTVNRKSTDNNRNFINSYNAGTIYSLPTVNNPDRFVCPDQSIDLSSMATPAGGSFSGTGVSGDDFQHSIPGGYTVTYTFTDGNGCTNSDNATITVRNPPSVSAGTDRSFCPGGSTSLSASGATTYTWSPVTGLSDPNIANPNVSGLSNTQTYTVTGTDNNGCINTDQVTVSVAQIPEADAGDDIVACSGINSQLNGSNSSGTTTITYSWSGSGIVSGATTATPTINVNSSRSFTLTVTDQNGCMDSDVVQVNVGVATASAGSDKTICQGESVLLSAAGGVNYSWSPASGLSDTDVSSPIASPSTTTVYTVTVTDNNGCTDTDQVTVNVNSAPTLTVSSDQTICKGESITLTASGASTYSWSPSTGLNANNIATVIARPTSSTLYTVTGTSSQGCETSLQVTVNVNDLPVADAGDDQILCAGESVILNGSAAGGTPPYTYAWSGGSIASGANTATPTVNPSINTNYTLTVRDANGCSATDQVMVELTSGNANAGADQSICMGESITLSASGGNVYSWSRIGGGPTQLNDNSSATPVFTPSAPGVYQLVVVVNDGNDCSESDDITITVNSVPSMSVTSDQSICKGESVILTASGANNYDWSPSSGLNVTNLASVTASPTTTTVYEVEGQNASGCSQTVQVVVYVNELPDADAGSDVETCQNEAVQLNGSASLGTGPYSYLWAGPGTISDASIRDPYVTVSSNSTFVLTITDSNGCSDTDEVRVNTNSAMANAGTNKQICQGESVALSASGGISYAWNNASSLNDDGVSDPIASPTTTTTYTVTVTDNDGCSDTDDVTVTVLDVPVLTVSPDQTICKGGSVSLTASGASSYQWSPTTGLNVSNIGNVTASPSSTTVYSVTGSNGSCESTETVIVYVNDLPIADAGDDQSLCRGDLLSITGDASGNGPFTYSWSGADIVSGANSATVSVNPNVDRTYTLTVTDANGCVDSDVVLVRVNEATASAGSNKTICEGQSVQLSASGGVSYNWSPASGLSDNDVSSPIASPSTTTTYTVTVTDANGCTDTDAVTVTVNTRPVLSGPGDQVICDGESVQLPVSGASLYEWSPRSGLSNEFSSSPIASPSVTTQYTVTGRNAAGCESSQQIIVTVNEVPTVDAGDDLLICGGSVQTIDANVLGNGPFSYTWTGADIVSGATSEDVTVSPTVSGNYALTVTDNNGCSATDQMRVTVTNATANAGVNRRLCVGEEISLSGSGGISYQWSRVGGGDTNLNDETVSSPLLTGVAEETYDLQLTVTDNNGCVDTDLVTITVDALPTLVVSSDQTICYGSSVTLNASGADSYQWSPSTGLNISNLSEVIASPSTTTVYTVTGTSSAGCNTSEDIIVYVNELPQADAGSDPEVCAQQDLDITASASSGTGPYTYSWSGNGIISASNLQTITVNISADETYLLTVTDANGCVDTDQVTVNVNDLPNAYTTVDGLITTNTDICIGTTVQLEAAGGTSYLWTGDAGLSNTSIANPTITVDATKYLSVVVTNGNGCQQTVNLTLNAVNNPTVDGGNILNLCIDDEPYDLRADVNIQGGSFTGTGITNNFLFDPTDAGEGIHIIDYDVSVGGCSGSDTREVRVHGKPTLSISAPVEICPGESVQIVASGALNYQWSPNINISSTNVANPYVYPTISRTYTVVGTDQYGCQNSEQVTINVNDLSANAGVNQVICQGESVVLEGESNVSNVSYQWSPSTGLNDDGIARPTASPNITTTYRLTVTDQNLCSVSDELTITVENKPTLEVGSKLSVCSNSSSPIDLRNDVNISGGSFSGSTSALEGVLFYGDRDSPGLYFVDYTVNVGSCTLTETREIEIVEPVTVSVEESEIFACNGQTVSLSAVGGVSYTWSPNININDVSSANPEVTVSGTRTYTVTATDIRGCESSAQVTINEVDDHVTASSNVTICEGESTTLTATGVNNYTWNNTSSLSSATGSVTIASPTNTTTYTVTGINSQGCQSTDQVTVTVIPRPNLELGPQTSVCLSDDPFDVRVFANIAGGTWSSSSPALDGVIFNPTDDDGLVFLEYSVLVDGCTISDTKEILILDEPQISVSNDTELCLGESVQLSASGGVYYEWVPATNMDDAFIFNPTVTPSSTTDYTVYVTDNNGCTTSGTVRVEVNQMVTTIIPDQTICEGESIQLFVTGGNEYVWDNTASLDDFRSDQPIASPLVTTTYNVNILDNNGCSQSRDVTVTVEPAPFVSAGDVLRLCRDDAPYDLRDDVSYPGGTFTSTSSGLVGVLWDPVQVSNAGVFFVDYEVVVGNCSVTSRREIEVIDYPVVAFQRENIEICKGESVQIQASGGSTYEWYPNVAIDDIHISNPTVNPAVSMTYSVLVENEYGCSTTKEIDIIVHEVTANAGSDVSICEGEVIELDGSGGDLFYWDGDDIVSDNEQETISVSPDVTTTYTLQVTTNQGCMDTDQVLVNVNDYPQLEVGDPIVLCSNDANFYDLRNDINISEVSFESTSPGLNGVLFDATQAGIGVHFIDVTATNNGCVITKSKEIRVEQPQQTQLTQDTYYACAGETLQLHAYNANTYQWTPTLNLNNSNISNPTATVTESITYTVTGWDFNGCSSSKQVTINVVDDHVQASEDVTICEGESVVLSAGGVEEYSWDNSGTLNNSSISNPVASPVLTTTYTVTGINSQGCISNDQVVVTVLPQPLLDVGGPVIVCQDANAFDVRSFANILGGTWSSSSSALDGVVFDPSKENPGIIFLHYQVESNGCVVSAEKEIEIVESPEVTVIDDREICRSESIQLSASGGISYEWFPKSNIDDAYIFNPTVSPEVTTQYSVVVTDINGCDKTETINVEVNQPQTSIISNQSICRGETIQLYATGGREYVWNNSSTLSDHRTDEPFATPLNTTNYSVQIIDNNGCVSNESVTITVNDAPQVSVGDVLQLCEDGAPYDLRNDVSVEGGVFSSASNGLVGVLYDPRQSEGPGIYFVDYHVTIGNCTTVATREIKVNGLPMVTAKDAEVCEGDSVRLLASGGSSYSWYPTEGLNNPTIPNPMVSSPQSDSEYTVTVTDDLGCVSSQTVEVRLNELHLNISDDQVICLGESIRLSASGGQDYIWSPSNGLDNPTIANPNASPNQTTTYYVTAYDQRGCQKTDSVTVTVRSIAEAPIISSVSGCQSDDVLDLRTLISDPLWQHGTFSGNGVSGVTFDWSQVSSGITFVDYDIVIGGCDQRLQIEMQVEPNPNITISDTRSVCRGESVELLATGGQSYSWTPQEFLDDPFSPNPMATVTENTTFEVAVTNDRGCTSLASVDVEIIQNTVNAGGDFDICINAQPVTLTGVTPDGNWSGSSIINGQFDPLTAGLGEFEAIYTVVNQQGCIGRDTIMIRVLEEPLLSAGETIHMCTNDNPVNLLPDVSIRGGEFSGEYVTGTFFSPEIAGDFIIEYSLGYAGCQLSAYREIRVKEPTSITFGQDLELCEFAQPYLLTNDVNVFGGEFSSNVDGLIEGNILHPENVSTGLYEINYTYVNAFQCETTVSKVVNIRPIENVDAGPDIVVCNTIDDFDLTKWASHKNGEFTGPHVNGNKFNSVEATPGLTYKIDYFVDNGNGCSSYDSLYISVLESSIVDFGIDTIVCVNSAPIELNFSGELSSGVWSGPGEVDDYFYPSLAGEGIHTLNYYNDNFQCDIAGTRTFTVVSLPEPAKVDQSEYYGCEGEFIELRGTLSDSALNSNTRVSWYRNQDSEPFAFGSQVQFQIESDERIYYKSVNQFGCESNQNTFVNINVNNPTASIRVSNNNIDFGTPVQFFAEGLTNASSFLWDFGDGLISFEKNPWHFYYLSGEFDVSLTVVSSTGCSRTVTLENAITVGYDPIIDRDGDGVIDSTLLVTGVHQTMVTDLNMYPVPAEKQLTIEFRNQNLNVREYITIGIYGLDGTLVQMIRTRPSPHHNQFIIDISKLPEGMYILTIRDNGNNYQKETFIKK